MTAPPWARWARRRDRSQVDESPYAGRHAAPYAPDDHLNGDDTPEMVDVSIRTPDEEFELRGWQVKMLADLEQSSVRTQRAQLHGRTLADWLRDDAPAGDVELAGYLLIVRHFLGQLHEDVAEFVDPVSLREADALVYRAFASAVELAVLDLTAVARSQGEG